MNDEGRSAPHQSLRHPAKTDRTSPRSCPEGAVHGHCRFWCIVCDRLYQPGFC